MMECEYCVHSHESITLLMTVVVCEGAWFSVGGSGKMSEIDAAVGDEYKEPDGIDLTPGTCSLSPQ